MSYNSNLPADTTAPAEIRENLRALKEDKIVDAATAVVADSAAKLTTARKISLEGDATGSTSFDGSADVAIQVDVLSADMATKLETARTINGVEFDGTKDIKITVPTMPIGSIIMWAFSTLPGGDDKGKWLECNGQSTDGYPELAAIAGSNVPNYQGMFLRGYGSQTFSQNNGSTVGITSTTYSSGDLNLTQGDAIRNIYGNAGNGFDTERGSYVNGAFYSKYEAGAVAGAAGDYYAHFDFMDASRILPTANEFRPINKAVIYLIKAKQ